jgi:hypothetical protein
MACTFSGSKPAPDSGIRPSAMFVIVPSPPEAAVVLACQNHKCALRSAAGWSESVARAVKRLKRIFVKSKTMPCRQGLSTPEGSAHALPQGNAKVRTSRFYGTLRPYPLVRYRLKRRIVLARKPRDTRGHALAGQRLMLPCTFGQWRDAAARDCRVRGAPVASGRNCETIV